MSGMGCILNYGLSFLFQVERLRRFSIRGYTIMNTSDLHSTDYIECAHQGDNHLRASETKQFVCHNPMNVR